MTLPSDLQLLTINRMCVDRDLVPPEAIASSAEASEIITAIGNGSYDPARYTVEHAYVLLDSRRAMCLSEQPPAIEDRTEHDRGYDLPDDDERVLAEPWRPEDITERHA